MGHTSDTGNTAAPIYYEGTSNISTATTTLFGTQGATTTTGTYYARAISSYGCSTVSAGVLVTINTQVAFTTQPAATQTKCKNASGTALTVAASGTGPTYAWFSNTSNSNTGGTALGVTTTSYTPLTTTAGTFYYY